MTVTIEHVKIIARTPAFGLAMIAHTELLKRGWSDTVVMVGTDHQAILALVEGEAAGVITFTHSDWCSQLDIWLGYVVPRFRRRGLYRQMWEALVERGRALGAKVIMGNTDIRNASMRATAAALGRQEVAVIFRFDLNPVPEAPAPTETLHLTARPVDHEALALLGFKMGDEIEVLVAGSGMGSSVPVGTRGVVLDARGPMLIANFPSIDDTELGLAAARFVSPAYVGLRTIKAASFPARGEED